MGGTALVGYNCLYFWILRPPDCLMSLRRLMSLFLMLGSRVFVKDFCRCWCLVEGLVLCCCSLVGP